jgi:hypothetical protein
MVPCTYQFYINGQYSAVAGGELNDCEEGNIAVSMYDVVMSPVW